MRRIAVVVALLAPLVGCGGIPRNVVETRVYAGEVDALQSCLLTRRGATRGGFLATRQLASTGDWVPGERAQLAMSSTSVLGPSFESFRLDLRRGPEGSVEVTLQGSNADPDGWYVWDEVERCAGARVR